jgi:organic hydroperoxide reductase OsmC/OhrA
VGDQSFSISIEHLEGYQFRVEFDWPVPDIVMDEPEPLGERRGPNASRLLAAAVGNCLTASLLFCLTKTRVELGGARTIVTAVLSRNERGRLRVGSLDVSIQLSVMPEAGNKAVRCSQLFEDFCVVTASVREGIPIHVTVTDDRGTVLHHSGSPV